ncbi:MAG TPA: amyloid fiber anchoring/assembly protein TapA [Lentibacillus sp.]|uniref:amyloid fiber anchoring/assembly protein TapA n=1 Tax=Lentibacillus sp. TaxID=1925746 RepID=UPI002B4B9309|nr:amyloid fiber anchoring/assembly protein TapA [Lentibacillus sp.]HLR63589.1 amyloid fiber anchoring/assembly protein TapA [Lentibacillus sp.]
MSQKQQKLLIASKLLVSGCLLLFAAGYITSSTGAYFMDVEKQTNVIQAGTWWDGSDLGFTGRPSKSQGDQCPVGEISVKLKNNGQAMTGPTAYKVYYKKAGDPKEGKAVKEGELKPLQEGEAITLNYQNADNGVYRFKMLQRPEYNEEAERTDVWSKKITVNCEEQTSDTKANEAEKKENSKKQSDSVSKDDGQENSENDKNSAEKNESDAADSTQSANDKETNADSAENKSDVDHEADATDNQNKTSKRGEQVKQGEKKKEEAKPLSKEKNAGSKNTGEEIKKDEPVKKEDSTEMGQ